MGPVTQFERYIGIDYSGAETPAASLKGLRVYVSEGDGRPTEALPPPSPRKYWTRKGIAAWLIDQLGQGVPTIVGIDHGFSFPIAYFEAHGLPHDWPAFLEDFQRHWPTDGDHVYVDDVRQGELGNGAARTGSASCRRLTEFRTGGKSVFHFDVQGSVAKSTHAGIPWLLAIKRRLGVHIHIWPFDGWDVPAGRSTIVEVYPALWSASFDREDRTNDQHDAFSVAAWLADADRDGRLAGHFTPDLAPDDLAQAAIEGWILSAEMRKAKPSSRRARPPGRIRGIPNPPRGPFRRSGFDLPAPDGSAGSAFDRASLLDALDAIGTAAIDAGVALDIAIYGGSALMLASDFDCETACVDVAEIAKPWPDWLARAVAEVAARRGWSPDWLNEAVQFHLSPLATLGDDHPEFGSFPRGGAPAGLRVFVPTAEYMLALKLKAVRTKDPVEGAKETADLRNLLRAAGVPDVDAATAVLARYFPRSAADAETQRSLRRHLWPEKTDGSTDTLCAVAERLRAGEARDLAFAGFLDTFYAADAEARRAMIAGEPPLLGDPRLDALMGAVAEYLAKQCKLGRVPGWCGGPARRLAEPWFTTEGGSGMQEYLAFTSPAEFRHRNIFTSADPLTRARTAAARAASASGA